MSVFCPVDSLPRSDEECRGCCIRCKYQAKVKV